MKNYCEVLRLRDYGEWRRVDREFSFFLKKKCIYLENVSRKKKYDNIMHFLSIRVCPSVLVSFIVAYIH